jgi:hypothetical protein
MKRINITLAELIETLSNANDETKEKQIESMGVDSGDNLVILFTDRSKMRIPRTKKATGKG